MNDRFKFRYLYQDKLREVIDLDFDNEYITVRTSPHETVSTGLELKNLMQCTGLKDKNGKLIYEGDIVKTWKFSTGRTQLSVIVWNEARCGFRLYDIDKYLRNIHNSPQSMVNVTTIEVLGNVHENPELLEEQCANQLNKE